MRIVNERGSLMTAFRQLPVRPMRTLGLAVALLALLPGCRHAPLSYRLVGEGPTTVLFPPTQALDEGTSLATINIRNVRKNASPPTGCDIDNSLLALHWNGKTAQVKLMADTYGLQTLYFASVESVQALRSDLLSLEDQDCVGTNEGQKLVRNLVEELPLPPQVGHLLRFGSTAITRELT